ncbi:MAG: carboxypeptidase-like regulatory domain-containing protein, partial [Nannocystaceae bacterium]
MAAAIDPDDALWSAEPDAFDDFDRGDQGSLGSTPVGAYPWALRAGRRPRIVERVLMPRGGDLLESQAFVGELEVADLLLSLAVRTTRPEAVWTVSYRSNEEGGYRIEGSADSVALFLGEQRIAHASVELPVDAWSQVQLVVEGAVHHVMIDGRSVLEAEDHQRLSAGFIGLGGSNGVELDDLWILSTAHDGEATGGTSGGGLGGGSRGPLRMRDDGAMEMTAGQGPGGELDGGNEPGVVSVPQQPAAVGEAGEGPMLEPLRLAGAPAQDLTVPTTLYKQVQFLFEGPGAEQQGVDFAALSPARIALIHGWVRDTMGQPLEDVEVWSLGHPELGTTATRADGSYDLVVGGGIDHSIVLTHPGYLSVQRHVVTRAGESQRADDAVLIEVDSESSFITFSNPIEVHHATTPEDDAPARMATVMFRGGTLATMVFEDGSTAPLPEMTVRLTEYTAGAEGLEQMPAEIAPGTAYNYAIEISADEAEAVGAASVELDQPAVLYVDDFTEWGVGTVVPSGAFDRGEGRWHGEPDGLVIEVLWLDGIGRAEIDLTGDGIEATPEELLALGFSDDERIELGSIYADGSQLWRTPIHHFTPFDLNPAAAANGEPPPDGLGPDENGDIDGCEGNGSIIGLDNQDLGERLPVAGTPFSLEYRSSRTRGAP